MEGNLLFVGGDLSGIQKFIYNITSKRAMVSLKGRSFYLKDFTEKICNKILNIPELSNSTIAKSDMKIYCSGGKFYLQIPDTEQIRNTIEKIKQETEEKLWNEHKGQLSINIDYVPFCYVGKQVTVGEETGNIGILWTHITQKFNALKNQKFRTQILNNYESFFDVQEVGGDAKVCQVTGIEGAKDYPIKFKDKDGENEETMTLLPSVKAQIELGKELRDKHHFKMLEEYAGETYLGILRMDVDNLGSKFIKSEFASMDKYKDFSGKLDIFFNSENGNLHDIQTKYNDYLNIVYAGGDDIFAVGRWDKVIDFASDVHDQFAQYSKEVLKDKNLSISGGITMVNAKFPIAKAAELAGDAEDAAKKYNNGQKNAFNMFGESISWGGQFEYVKSYKDQFVTLIDQCGLSRGILHKIMSYAAIVKENKKIEEENKNGNNKRKPDMSYLWHSAYYLTRFMGKEKDNKAVYDFCKDLRDKQLVKTDNYRLISLAARWAEFELREIKDSINN